MREILKQPQYEPIPVPEQLAVLVAVTNGLLDHLPLESLGTAEQKIRRAATEQAPAVGKRLQAGEKLQDEDREALVEAARKALESM